MMYATALASKPSASAIEAGNRTLKVGGITPFSLTDYPGLRAAVVFVQGCPWQCGYCQNPHLQMRLQQSPLQWQKILKLLQQRIDRIDAVVFSGGEPTLDPALAGAISDVRGLGLRVGLHCGGAYPDRLEAILPLLDWIALDIKAPFPSYEKVTGVPGSGEQARHCAAAVLASGLPHEFRTTFHSALLQPNDIMELAQSLQALGASNYVLQIFRTQGCRNKALKAAQVSVPPEELLARLGSMFPAFSYRAD